jgi:phage terminase large subunit GpA-like protein
MADGSQSSTPKAPKNLGDIVLGAASIFRPPERLTVAEAALKYVKVHAPPRYSGPYKPLETPYMIEPQNLVMSRDYKSVIFCGPSQTGKSEALIVNVSAFLVKCNPMDVIIFASSQSQARDFSKRRIDRLHRHSKYIGAELLSGQHSDNTHDKTYRSGMMLSISWPSSNEMSSKPVPITLLTEYDRMPDDVDGEGSPFLLAQKRSTTFGSMAMTVVDSSPSRDVEDTKWKPTTLHEAPPCNGVLGLYNQGDRRRWYWPCPHCGEFFEGHFGLLKYDTIAVVNGEKVPLSFKKAGDSVYMECPKNGCRILPTSKKDMNLHGVWLREGERMTSDGKRIGTPTVSESASYWLRGTAATYISWKDLVVKYLNAEKKFLDTGTQEDLKTTTNTDQGDPYFPRGNETNRLAEDLMDQALELPKQMVPKDVRALFAVCDTQKNRWEVQIMGIRPAAVGYDIVVIDRYPIVKSNRTDTEGERLWVKPGAHLEDWDLLVEHAMDKKYPLFDGSGEMSISMTFCDMGGKEGVTTNAYDFYRKLKNQGRASRFMLTKGEPNPNAPRADVSYPDTKRKDRTAQARGEIPVLFLNSNVLKDSLNSMLDRDTPGGGKIDFPDWLDLQFFEELTVEIRTLKGWMNKAGRRNETWDLLYMFIGACVWRRVDQVDWADPPAWLSPWETNPFVEFSALAPKGTVDKGKDKPHSFAQLAQDLA